MIKVLSKLLSPYRRDSENVKMMICLMFFLYLRAVTEITVVSVETSLKFGIIPIMYCFFQNRNLLDSMNDGP